MGILVARRRARLAALCFVAGCLAASAPAARAAEPVGEPVKWDQARVTQYAVDLDTRVRDAYDQMIKSPTQITPQQRTVWFELKEDLRLLQNSSAHLKAELQEGKGVDETRATFDRIDMLRRNAEEHGRSALIPAPVLDALVSAGAVHNQMKPYYHGKR
jgi:hypothetical protein